MMTHFHSSQVVCMNVGLLAWDLISYLTPCVPDGSCNILTVTVTVCVFLQSGADFKVNHRSIQTFQSPAPSDTAEVMTLCEIESHHWRIFPTHSVLSCTSLSRPIILNELWWARRKWIPSVSFFIDVQARRKMYLFFISPCKMQDC